MNTHWEKLSNLTRQFPTEADTLVEVEKLFSEENSEFDLAGLYALSNPKSIRSLNDILKVLVEERYVQKVFRVVSSVDQGGIEEYDSFVEIPPTLYDWRSNENIEVSPKNIRIIYKSL